MIGSSANIAWTWWILAAGVSSVVVGQGHLLVNLRSVGGGVRSFFRALRATIASYVIIVGVDFVGGLAVGCSFAFLGATEPAQLVRLVEDRPAIGWSAVGLLGPVVSDRTFVGSLIRGRFDPLLPNREHPPNVGTSTTWRLRNEAIAGLVNALWRVVRTESFARYRQLKAGMKMGLASGGIRASEALYVFRDYFQHSRTKPARFVSEQLALLEDETDDIIDLRDGSAELIATIGVRMLHDGHWDPIEVLVSQSGAP